MIREKGVGEIVQTASATSTSTYAASSTITGIGKAQVESDCDGEIFSGGCTGGYPGIIQIRNRLRGEIVSWGEGIVSCDNYRFLVIGSLRALLGRA